MRRSLRKDARWKDVQVAGDQNRRVVPEADQTETGGIPAQDKHRMERAIVCLRDISDCNESRNLGCRCFRQDDQRKCMVGVAVLRWSRRKSSCNSIKRQGSLASCGCCSAHRSVQWTDALRYRAGWSRVLFSSASLGEEKSDGTEVPRPR